MLYFRLKTRGGENMKILKKSLVGLILFLGLFVGANVGASTENLLVEDNTPIVITEDAEDVPDFAVAASMSTDPGTGKGGIGNDGL